VEADVRKAMLAAMGMLVTAAPALASWDFKIVDGPLGKPVGAATLAGAQGEVIVRCDTTGQNSLFLTMRPKGLGEGLEPAFLRAMTYRIDNGPARTANAIYDADEITIVNLVRGLMGGDLLFSMLGSKTLAFEIADKSKRTHTLLFDTTGARDAVLRAAEACGDTNWMARTN
jgi:hypothetical protein